MTYEANIAAYGIISYETVLTLVPHDIDWVKDRVRWYWDNKIANTQPAPKQSETEMRGGAPAEEGKKAEAATPTPTPTAKETAVAA